MPDIRVVGINGGLNTGSKPFDMADHESPALMNLIPELRALRKRRGSATYNSSPLLGAKPVVALHKYYREKAGAKFLAYTGQDVISPDTLEPLNVYEDGTASVVTDTITGVGTRFLNNVKAGDYFKFNADAHSTWTKVKEISTDLELTLTESYLGSETTGAYKVRKTLSESKVVRFVDAERRCFMTTGKDKLQMFDGSLWCNAGLPKPDAPTVDLELPSAPTAVKNVSTGTLNGSFQYRVSFVYGDEEGNYGAASDKVTGLADERVDLSVIPIGGTSVTSRRIYRADKFAAEYTYGTAEVDSGDSKHIVGTGTQWASNVRVGDKFKFDADTGSAWTTIEKIEDDGSIYLEKDYLGAETSGAYTIGKIDTAITYKLVHEIFDNVTTTWQDRGSDWREVADGTTDLESATNILSLMISLAGTVFAGTAPNGDIFRSANGHDWEKSADGTTDLDSATNIHALVHDTQGNLYAGVRATGNVYKSTDDGGTWIKVGDGTTDFGGTTAIKSMLCALDDSLYVGLDGAAGHIYKSTDFGASWVKVADATTDLGGAAQVDSLAQDSLGNIYAGIRPGGNIYKSDDDGASWSKVADGTADLGGATFVLSITGQTKLYAGTGINGDIYASEDQGATWVEVADGATDLAGATRVHSLLEDVFGHIYAATSANGDIYKSEDLGTTWTKSADGTELGSATVISSLAQSIPGNLYTGTSANGDIYATTLHGSLIEPGSKNGDYKYRIALVSQYTESNGGEESYTVSPEGQSIFLTDIPTGSNKVIARKIYRTAANGEIFFYLDTISDNETTVYLDNKGDPELDTDEPFEDHDEPPIFDHICWHNNRLWGAQGSTVWFSDLNNPEAFYRLYRYEPIAREAGDEITGLVSFWDGIYITKQSAIHKITGDTLNTYRKHVVHGSLGNAVPNSLQLGEYKGVACFYFRSWTALHCFTGSRFIDLTSLTIEPTLAEMLMDYKSEITSIYDRKRNRYLISYRKYNDTTNQRILAFYPFYHEMPSRESPGASGWFPLEGMSARSFCVWAKGNDKAELFFGTGDGNVLQAAVGPRDNASDIESSFQTKFFDKGDPMVEAKFRKLYLDISNENEVGVTLDVDDGAYTKPYIAAKIAGQREWDTHDWADATADPPTAAELIWEDTPVGQLIGIPAPQEAQGRRISYILTSDVYDPELTINSMLVVVDPLPIR